MSLIKNLKKSYGDFDLHIAELEIPDAGVSVLWGPSGSGKSSIFRCLIGMEECPSLSWKFSSQELMDLPLPERRIGVVFQTYELFPHLTARENILFPVRARGSKLGWTEQQVVAKFENWTSRLGISPVLDKKASLLSGGEQQRTALLRALMGNPRILLLDEPFAALDSNNKEQARVLLKELCAELKMPALLVSHDEKDLTYFGGRVFRIDGGRVSTQS